MSGSPTTKRRASPTATATLMASTTSVPAGVRMVPTDDMVRWIAKTACRTTAAVVAVEPARDRVAAEVDDLSAEALDVVDHRVEDAVQMCGQLLGAALRTQLVGQCFGQRCEPRNVGEQRGSRHAIVQLPAFTESSSPIACDVGLGPVDVRVAHHHRCRPLPILLPPRSRRVNSTRRAIWAARPRPVHGLHRSVSVHPGWASNTPTGGTVVGMTPEEMADLVHLRRARDLIDRDYAKPLDVPAMAQCRAHVAGALLAQVPCRVRRDALLLPHDATHRASQGAAASRHVGHRRLRHRRLHVARFLQFTLHRDRRRDTVAVPRHATIATARSSRRASARSRRDRGAIR